MAALHIDDNDDNDNADILKMLSHQTDLNKRVAKK
jgi:hypothetical protein